MDNFPYRDPFVPVLKNSPALNVTTEQNGYIKDILDICCSDSRFAEKAYMAIATVLNGGVIAPPVVSSLSPASINLGEPSFDLHVVGSEFTPFSIIVFNGYEEPTTFVSENELTTGVNMPLWQAPVVVPIRVRTGQQYSAPIDFEFTDPAVPEVLVTKSKNTHFGEEVKSEKKKLVVEEHHVKESKK
jgi:hypothetical protein